MLDSLDYSNDITNNYTVDIFLDILNKWIKLLKIRNNWKLSNLELNKNEDKIKNYRKIKNLLNEIDTEILNKNLHLLSLKDLISYLENKVKTINNQSNYYDIFFETIEFLETYLNKEPENEIDFLTKELIKYKPETHTKSAKKNIEKKVEELDIMEVLEKWVGILHTSLSDEVWQYAGFQFIWEDIYDSKSFTNLQNHIWDLEEWFMLEKVLDRELVRVKKERKRFWFMKETYYETKLWKEKEITFKFFNETHSNEELAYRFSYLYKWKEYKDYSNRTWQFLYVSIIIPESLKTIFEKNANNIKFVRKIVEEFVKKQMWDKFEKTWNTWELNWGIPLKPNYTNKKFISVI